MRTYISSVGQSSGPQSVPTSSCRVQEDSAETTVHFAPCPAWVSEIQGLSGGAVGILNGTGFQEVHRAVRLNAALRWVFVKLELVEL